MRINGEEASGVRAAFDQSYATLSAEARRAFRLLGLVPGVDFTADALAAMAGTTPARAGELLERLAEAHLVDQHRSAWYAFHDLLRRFARDRTGVDDDDAGRAAATSRLYDWYLRNVDAAARLLYPQILRLPPTRRRREDLPDEAFSDRAGALEWLDTLRPGRWTCAAGTGDLRARRQPLGQARARTVLDHASGGRAPVTHQGRERPLVG